MDMAVNRVRRGFNPMVQATRSFYYSFGELGMRMYHHAHDGFKLGCKIGMIESIDRRKDPSRARANDVLGMTQLYHPIDPAKLDRLPVVPFALRDEEVLEQLRLFDKIKALDRSGAGISAYSELVNGGRLPLAMLAVLVDYATTHRMEDRLDELVEAEAPNPVFRTFSSIEEAERSYDNHAHAGLRFHAPIAELFGYPLLAGDILNHAFHTLYPEIHAHVRSALSDPLMQRKLELTQSVVRGQARALRQSLSGIGFDATLTMRNEKHSGKLMRKVYRQMEDRFSQSPQFEILSDLAKERGANPLLMPEYLASLRAYICAGVSQYDISENIHDLVALRVVLHRFHGRSIDEMPEEQAEALVELASDQILVNLKSAHLHLEAKELARSLDVDLDRKRKSNGYRANHFDASPAGSDLLRFEIQLKTSLWHAIAEEGYAAHFYYLGGDNQYVDMIASSASELLSTMKNGKGASAKPIPSSYRDSG